MPAELGSPAPEFVLKDQNNQQVALGDFRGRKHVLVVFYPSAFTRTCEGELQALQADLARFQNDHVQLLTISVDSVYSHKVWAEQEGFTFPLLADFWPHGAVARAYGCFDEEGGRATRGSYIIDSAGVLRWKVVTAIPDARNHLEYVEVLTAL